MTVQDDQTKSAQLVTRLERLPFSNWHRNFFILAFCGIALTRWILRYSARRFRQSPANSALPPANPAPLPRWDYLLLSWARFSGAGSSLSSEQGPGR